MAGANLASFHANAQPHNEITPFTAPIVPPDDPPQIQDAGNANQDGHQTQGQQIISGRPSETSTKANGTTPSVNTPSQFAPVNGNGQYTSRSNGTSTHALSEILSGIPGRQSTQASANGRRATTPMTTLNMGNGIPHQSPAARLLAANKRKFEPSAPVDDEQRPKHQRTMPASSTINGAPTQTYASPTPATTASRFSLPPQTAASSVSRGSDPSNVNKDEGQSSGQPMAPRMTNGVLPQTNGITVPPSQASQPTEAKDSPPPTQRMRMVNITMAGVLAAERDPLGLDDYKE